MTPRPLQTLVGRASSNLTAQGYNQIVTIAAQLLSGPVLISSWGLHMYGVWLLLTAIPAYLSLSDLGFTFIAKNDMSIRYARGDQAGALETYQTTLVLILISTLLLSVITTALITLFPASRWFDIGNLSSKEANSILVTQISSILLYQFFSPALRRSAV